MRVSRQASERASERARERQSDRDTERQTDRQWNRGTDRLTSRQRQSQVSKLVTGSDFFFIDFFNVPSATPEESRRDSEKHRSNEKTSDTFPDDEEGGKIKTKG